MSARFFLAAAVIGLVAAAIGWVTTPGVFAGAWLAALTWFASWALGSLGLLLIHALTGGRWGVVLRPALLAGSGALILLVPLAAPLALTAGRLYPWLSGPAPAGKDFYLNAPFFAGRAIVYLVVWCGLAALTSNAAADEARLRRLAPGALAALALTVTFAAIDTGMALDPDFTSSVYGLIALAGAALLALSVAILATALGPVRSRDDWAYLGRLLLGLVVFWAYLDFMQFLIVWESDLTREAPWYLVRGQGLWGGIAWTLAIGHFGLPFALLLGGSAQRRPAVVLSVAGLLAALEMLRAWWLILPSLGHSPGWIDAAAVVGLAGLAGCCLFLRLDRPASLAGAGGRR